MTTEPNLADHDPAQPASSVISFDAKEFPWWLIMMLMLIVSMSVAVVFNEEYWLSFRAIFPILSEEQSGSIFGSVFSYTNGLAMTLYLTVGSFVVAIVLGLLIGLARLAETQSRNWFMRFATTAVRNVATFYIELVRGIPMIVFIFAVALVFAPDAIELFNLEPRAVTNAWRGAAALSLFYAAFIAEVFRAGIQSVPSGQREAGESVGLSRRQVTRLIVLPQAIRNIMPALGNDLIALMKDTSLVSVLAVRELTQMGRLYSGSSFRFRESFFILMVVYVTLTLGLSLLLRWYERRIAIPG